MKKPPSECLKKAILLLAYQKKGPSPLDQVKWTSIKVSKVLQIKPHQVKAVVDKFKRQYDPNLTKI